MDITIIKGLKIAEPVQREENLYGLGLAEEQLKQTIVFFVPTNELFFEKGANSLLKPSTEQNI